MTCTNQRSRFWQDTRIAGSCAAILSVFPSTVHAWLTGGDMMQATRAAGAMLIPPESSDIYLFAAAAVVHATISLLWAALLTWLLPRKRTTLWAIAALAAIAVLDLRVIRHRPSCRRASRKWQCYWETQRVPPTPPALAGCDPCGKATPNGRSIVPR